MVAAIKGNIRDASDGKPKCIENLYSMFYIFGSKSEEKEQLLGFEM